VTGRRRESRIARNAQDGGDVNWDYSKHILFFRGGIRRESVRWSGRGRWPRAWVFFSSIKQEGAVQTVIERRVRGGGIPSAKAGMES